MAAFHGDPMLQELVSKIARAKGVRWGIETGTFHGDSTLFMSDLFEHVWTIEIRQDFAKVASARFASRISLVEGRSQELLSGILEEVLASREGPVFVFLDAHWQDDWPLREELGAIQALREAHPGRLIALVDDFQVPDRPDLYGTHGGGGTPGSLIYGPRIRPDPTPCDWNTFGSYLEGFLEVWFPDYPGPQPGYVVVSDVPLGSIPGLRRTRPT